MVLRGLPFCISAMEVTMTTILYPPHKTPLAEPPHKKKKLNVIYKCDFNTMSNLIYANII